MLLRNERQEIVSYGRRMLDMGLTKGTSGNLSIYNRRLGLMAISPSGMDYNAVEDVDVVVMDLMGNIVDGRRKPSSEFELHRILYDKRQDVNAVVHCHTVYATIFACLGMNIEPVHYMIALAGPNVRCAEYATFGTKQLAENAYRAMTDRNAVLLANHGAVAAGETLAKAINIMEEVEYCAEIYYRAKSIGNPVVISENEMKIMMEKFKTYGQNTEI